MKIQRTLLATFAACLLAGAATVARAQSSAAQGLPSEVAAKVAALSSAKPAERASAACALGRMREVAAPAVPHLVKLLSDGAPLSPEQGCGNQEPFEDEGWEPGYEQVREPSPGEAATHALMAIGEPAMGALKETLLRGADWRARKNAAWALAHRGEAIDELVQALRDEAWQVRAQSAYALFQRGGAETKVVEALIAAALKDAAWQVRQQAVFALGHKGSGQTDVVAPLAAALRDADARVRGEAAGALWHTADSRAFEPLMAALRDEDSGVRKRAAQTLGNRAGDREVQLLIAARNDKNARVREGVRRALDVIKDRMRGTETSLRPVNIPD